MTEKQGTYTTKETQGGIIRVKKDDRYFSASNEPFNDSRLSWEARGLMGYLLSKPNDWQVRMADLEKQGPAGNFKLRRMLAELRKYGYMNRIRITLEGGKFDWITEVYESPTQNPNPSKKVIKTSGGKSTSGLSTSGKAPDVLKTESLIPLELFKGYFGKFLSEKELHRWETLYEAAGKDRADELAQWAFKKEIHMMNRAGLMDSLETAAKNWREKQAKEKRPTPAVHIPDMSDIERILNGSTPALT